MFKIKHVQNRDFSNISYKFISICLMLFCFVYVNNEIPLRLLVIDNCYNNERKHL